MKGLLFLGLLFVLSCMKVVQAETYPGCIYEDPASGLKYDLSKLRLEAGSEDWLAGDDEEDDLYIYHINVCNPITYKSETTAENPDVGILQISKEDNREWIAGAASSLKIYRQDTKGKGGHLVLKYTGGEKCGERHGNVERTSTVKLFCNPSADVGLGDPVLDTETNCTYNFIWETNAACPVTEGGSTNYFGWFVLFFFLFVLSYLVIGVAFKRFYRGAKGIEQIPNIDTWRAIGACCGGVFTKLTAKCRKTPAVVKYRGLGDGDDDQLIGADDEDERLADV
eukprot:Colp12_sorted_trinity150504_noHs@5958